MDHDDEKDCGNPDCPIHASLRLSRTKVRVLKDDAGDVYVSRIDLMNFLAGLVRLQEAVGGALNPPFMNSVAIQAMHAMGDNIYQILHTEEAHIAPSTVDDVPDTVPDSWIGTNGQSEQT